MIMTILSWWNIGKKNWPIKLKNFVNVLYNNPEPVDVSDARLYSAGKIMSFHVASREITKN